MLDTRMRSYLSQGLGMGKKGRDRSSRRRAFDDDAFEGNGIPPPSLRPAFRKPSQDNAPAGPAIEATVTWFNAEKGFGFVELGDGTGDAFLHVAVLQKAGHEVVAPQTKLRVQIGQGQKGRQVTAVLEVDASNASAAQANPRSSPNDRGRAELTTATEVGGTVKWFKSDKGFGFAVADDGGKDVFVHSSIVQKAGLEALVDGQRVVMRVVNSQKGREAISIALSG
jgi:cold shock protein